MTFRQLHSVNIFHIRQMTLIIRIIRQTVTSYLTISKGPCSRILASSMSVVLIAIYCFCSSDLMKWPSTSVVTILSNGRRANCSVTFPSAAPISSSDLSFFSVQRKGWTSFLNCSVDKTNSLPPVSHMLCQPIYSQENIHDSDSLRPSKLFT